MRWLVTGASGMLGRDVVDVLVSRGHEVDAVDRDDLDITDAAAAAARVAGAHAVVNCAAWTAVDAAEEAEPQAFAVNALGPSFLARAAHATGATLVHVSTDYVVEGTPPEPVAEDAVARPLSAYARTKLAGEWAVRAEAPGRHVILRTAWLYGAGGACFPRTIVRVAREKGSLTVVDDQHGQPTWTRDVAAMAADAVELGVPAGTYHATSSGRTTWFEFARSAVQAAGMDPEIVKPTSSGTLGRAAVRPSWSVLAHDRGASVGLPQIGPWAERWAVAAPHVVG